MVAKDVSIEIANWRTNGSYFVISKDGVTEGVFVFILLYFFTLLYSL